MAARATPVERWAGFSLLCAAGRLEVPGLAVAVRGRGAPPGCGRCCPHAAAAIYTSPQTKAGSKRGHLTLTHVSDSRVWGLDGRRAGGGCRLGEGTDPQFWGRR